jgi:lysine-N-methylase
MSVLHFSRTLPALLPQYVSRFKCIGPECEDTCCANWRVTIDKKTFNSYRQSTHPELVELFAKNVKRQRSQASDGNYARIELNADTQECPMMADRLCAVQKNMDESYLSDTCFSYPRYSRNFSGQYEQALTLSCPEAARQALLAADAFDFVQGSITVRPAAMSEIKPTHGLSLALMNDVRIFCLQLVRTEGLELWQKLAVLGVFCESFTSTLAKGGHAAVPELLKDFVTMVEQGLVLDALVELRPNHEVQARVFALLWREKKHGAASPMQKTVLEAIAKGLGGDAETGQVTEEKLIESYSRGITRLPEALRVAPHLLEHYILNEMFRELFPFGSKTPYEHYLKLISRFGLLRLMLAAQCNTDGPLPDAAVLVSTTQVFCRRFQHDANFATQVNQALKNSGWDKLDKVYGFLRS